jgi:hypothetical protein
VKLSIEVEFPFGTIIYLKTAMAPNGDEDDRIPGQVVGFRLYPDRSVIYEVDWSNGGEGSYYDFQLTANPYPVEKESDDEKV